MQPKRHVQPSGLHWHGSLPHRGELYSMLPGWSLTVERLDAWGWRIPKPATGVNVTTGVHYRHRYVVELRLDNFYPVDLDEGADVLRAPVVT